MSLENKEIKRIMSILPPSYGKLMDSGQIHELNQTHGIEATYIQHIPEDVEKAQSEFMILCSSVLKSDYYTKGKIHRQGIVGRFLDDSGNKILYKSWYRFMCIDDMYREWEQPYYATNFEKYKGNNVMCINNMIPEILSYYRDRKINIVINEKESK